MFSAFNPTVNLPPPLPHSEKTNTTRTVWKYGPRLFYFLLLLQNSPSHTVLMRLRPSFKMIVTRKHVELS